MAFYWRRWFESAVTSSSTRSDSSVVVVVFCCRVRCFALVCSLSLAPFILTPFSRALRTGSSLAKPRMHNPCKNHTALCGTSLCPRVIFLGFSDEAQLCGSLLCLSVSVCVSGKNNFLSFALNPGIWRACFCLARTTLRFFCSESRDLMPSAFSVCSVDVTGLRLEHQHARSCNLSSWGISVIAVLPIQLLEVIG